MYPPTSLHLHSARAAVLAVTIWVVGLGLFLTVVVVRVDDGITAVTI